MSCPDCFRGAINTGTPKGEVIKLHGLPTYVAKPEGTPKGIVVILPDVFGWELSNGRVLADKYAEDGQFLVYLPDFMDGKAASGGALHSMESFLSPQPLWKTVLMKPFWLLHVIVQSVTFFYYNTDKACSPRVYGFFRGLRSDPATSSMKIGAAGFCWGGKYTVLLCQDLEEHRMIRTSTDPATPATAPMPLIDAGYTAHPSALKIPDDYEKVKLPLSVAIGDVDMSVKIDQVKIIKSILDKKTEAKEGEHETIIYEGAKHGFGIRADPENELQSKCCAEAEKQSIAWYTKFF